MDELISVIVPIYNVAPYLRQCIDSILNQTYRNLEIILVDDGSTDGSSDICDDYERREKQVKVIHQKNSGLTVTRRNGVNLAHGNYIGFVDGDDWIEENMYQVLYDHIYSKKVDIVTSRGYREYSWGTSETTLGDSILPGIYEIDEEEYYILTHLFPGIHEKEEYINGAVWNKLFKTEIIRSVLNEIDDNVHGFMDDTACIVGSIIRSKNIMISADILYHHRERSDSFTYSKNQKGLMQVNYGYLALKFIIEQSVYKEKVLPDLEKYTSFAIMDAYNNFFETDDYSFPQYFFKSHKVPISSKILLYGAGKVGKSFYQQIRAEGKYEILEVIDKNAPSLNNASNINCIKDFKFDFIIVAVKDFNLYKEILDTLVPQYTAAEKVVWERPLSIIDYFSDSDK